MSEQRLTLSEERLLRWLGEEEYQQYGKCNGPTLDSLIEKKLAQVHEDGSRQDSFIARGRGSMYRAVSLTDAGRKLLS